MLLLSIQKRLVPLNLIREDSKLKRYKMSEIITDTQSESVEDVWTSMCLKRKPRIVLKSSAHVITRREREIKKIRNEKKINYSEKNAF